MGIHNTLLILWRQAIFRSLIITTIIFILDAYGANNGSLYRLNTCYILTKKSSSHDSKHARRTLEPSLSSQSLDFKVSKSLISFPKRITRNGFMIAKQEVEFLGRFLFSEALKESLHDYRNFYRTLVL